MHFVQYVSYMKSKWNISLLIVKTTRKFGLDSRNGGFYSGVVQAVYQLFFTNGKLWLKENFKERYNLCFFFFVII